jgi:RNA polymerase sigma-70 factor (ECF subfamily)
MSSFHQPDPAPGQTPRESLTDDFMSLFLEHQRRIHGYLVVLLSGHQDADDLLQETAAVLWRRFHEFEPGTNFFAWACKTANLVVLGYRRRKGREAAMLDDTILEKIAACAINEDTLLVHRLAALEVCLEKLVPNDRLLIDRCYLANAKAKDVAVELGRPETSVYKSLGRIRRALLECIRRSLAAAEREGGP